MEIDVRAQHTWVTDTFRYQITVNKGGEHAAKYYLDIKKITQEMRHWFVHIYVDTGILDHTYLVEFYDVKALTARSTDKRSQFDTYSVMRFSLHEREQFFVDGIGEAILRFKRKSHARVIFSIPLRPALARIYDRLLKKHAQSVHCIYRLDLVEDGLYVIET